ncbi:ATP-grasp domain-containing protein [Halapricum desulfuricans]|uniref:Glutathione synthase/glutaminyl transferase/alpha-L-glutamate ligase n=1 Tax=Halapricum desulfuricans TaxID=2841257 RepID=A0A897NFL6_9EURY|nr:RimK family alpha-L-glutamate ligase [Halapricum desulfuricans]QSG09146.1 Glutathione synthase/glutaminyl transferase/alpha-L-glutamate ligase [Halapricum desulfuricans]
MALWLAVTTQAETYERLLDPLAERGIEVTPLQPSERTFDLSDPALPEVDVGFVYPSRLMEGGVVDAALSIPWVNGREAILRSRNKAAVLARLSQAGVPVPETTMVSNPLDDEAVAAAAERFDPPVVVKPNSTTRGTGVAKVSDLDSLLGVTDYLDLVQDYRATGDRSYLLQEYLPDARDYRVMVLDGEYVGAVERRLPTDARERGQWKHNVHRGAEAKGVDLDPELRELAERAADVLEIDYLGVDLLVTEDRAVVNETNARPTIDSATKYEDGFWDDLTALLRDTAAE